MPFVLKSSVRLQFATIILLAIITSWLLSAGLSNYLHYQRNHALWEEMEKNPNIYQMTFPEPQFGLKDFFFGSQEMMPRQPDRPQPPDGPGNPPPRFDKPDQKPPPPRDRLPLDQPPVDRPPATPSTTWSSDSWRTSFLLGNAGIALLLALLAGTWLSYHFTRPLGELIKGASALQMGDLNYRIRLEGENDFTRMASAMNNMAQRLRSHIAELEQDSERRKQMLADVAHELRSPVMTMQTMCSAMANGVADQPERKAQAIASLVRASKRLSHLVTDLLELAKLDLKELPIHLEKVELRDLLKTILQNHVTAAQQQQVVLHELAPGPPVTVMADPNRVAQIIDNLLNNSIQYAGPGAEIRVIVDPGDPVKITVSDNGKGIEPKHLPYVFDPFYRADQVRTPGDPHCGLGLRIARGLAEAQQGRLDLTSSTGQGTTVVVSLPRA